MCRGSEARLLGRLGNPGQGWQGPGQDKGRSKRSSQGSRSGKPQPQRLAGGWECEENEQDPGGDPRNTQSCKGRNGAFAVENLTDTNGLGDSSDNHGVDPGKRAAVGPT